MKNNKLLKLFSVFFKIGLFTFGGGYAMISLIREEVVSNNPWISDDDMMNIIVIAESTPGVLAVNTATFVGYRVGGIIGSALATLGVVLPSIIIISIISLFFDAFKSLQVVEYALNGIKAGVIILIMNSIGKLNKANPKNIFTVSLLITSTVFSLFFNIQTVYIIIASIVIGITAEFFSDLIKKRNIR